MNLIPRPNLLQENIQELKAGKEGNFLGKNVLFK